MAVVKMFHDQRSQVLDFEPERVCQRCETRRLLVLFPRTNRGFHSKVCQLCSDEERIKEETVLRRRCFWRNQKLVPLREKLKCGA
jgi:hypothetical protein